MFVDGWEYYNHAAIPTCAPHEMPDLTPINNGNIWKIGGGTPLLARWTTEWDCGYETNWWYVIKDTPFDISTLKAKRRYEINKGNKNFDVRIINPVEAIKDIYRVTIAAYSEWPKKYRPTTTREEIANSVKSWGGYRVFGAYLRETDVLYGYAIVIEHEKYVSFSVLRVDPEAERLGINAAIVSNILKAYDNRLHDRFYICDGERTIRHETAFQDYLEKYFNFRKAYCRVHVEYRGGMRFAVKILFPFRRIIKGYSRIGNKLQAILKMEEIVRQK